MIAHKIEGQVRTLSGNPALTSLDGNERAPLRAILTLGAKRMAEFGVYEVERAEVPAGKRVVSRGLEATADGVREVVTLEDTPPVPILTPQEKLAMVGLTPADLVAMIDAERARVR